MKKFSLILLTLVFACVTKTSAQFSNVDITPLKTDVGIAVISGTDTTQIHPIKYYKMKHGTNALAYGLTYGIAKIKNKALYKGSTSPNVVNVGDKLRFTFGHIPLEYMATLYMFQPQYSIRNFSLAAFSKKKDRRELTSGELSVWTGYDSGVTTENDDVKFTVETVAPNVYEATVTEAEPGEYCFIFVDGGAGVYTSVYDFTIKGEKKKRKDATDEYFKP